MEGFGVFISLGSVAVAESVNVVACRRAQFAVGDQSNAKVRHEGGIRGVGGL